MVSFSCMVYNARLHVTKCVTDNINNAGIKRMESPAYSSDRNLMEHIWDKLEREVMASLLTRQSLPELKDTLIEEVDPTP